MLHGLRRLFHWPRTLSRLRSTAPRVYLASKCGHQSPLGGDVTAFGKTRTLKDRELDSSGAIEGWCPDCVSKMVIQCAWCTAPIFPGDPITLYTPATEDFVVPDHAVVYRESPLQLVGCLGWNCADTGGNRAGFWIAGEGGKGRVYRVPSPVEIAFNSGRAVVVGDLGNIDEAEEPATFAVNPREGRPPG